MKKILIVLSFFIFLLALAAGVLYYFCNRPDRGLYQYTAYLEKSNSELGLYPDEMIQSHKYTVKIGDQFSVTAIISGLNAGGTVPDKINIVGDKSIFQPAGPFGMDLKAVKTGSVTIKVRQRLTKTKRSNIVFVLPNREPDRRNYFQKTYDSITDDLNSVIVTDTLTVQVVN